MTISISSLLSVKIKTEEMEQPKVWKSTLLGAELILPHIGPSGTRCWPLVSIPCPKFCTDHQKVKVYLYLREEKM